MSSILNYLRKWFREQWITQNFHDECTVTNKTYKGKNIIFTSEASSQIYQRSPADVIAIANMLGISNQYDALTTIRENCARVFQHAHLRKTYKGVA